MLHTKNEIEQKVKKILADIRRNYFENMPFKIEFENNLDAWMAKKIIANGWKVVVYVQEDQFPDKDEYAVITIIINDDTGEVESYADMSCGRPIPLKVVFDTNLGKYGLAAIN